MVADAMGVFAGMKRLLPDLWDNAGCGGQGMSSGNWELKSRG